MSDTLSYWTSALKQPFERLELPTDHLRLKSAEATVVDSVESPFTASAPHITSIAQQHNVDNATVYLSLYTILLFRYTGKDRFCTAFQRTSKDNQSLPIAVQVSPEGSAAEHIATIAQVFSNGDVLGFNNFKGVASELGLDDFADTLHWCDTAFAFNSQGSAAPAQTAAEIHLSATQNDNEASVRVDYSTHLFNKDTIERLLGHLGKLAESVANDANISVANLPMLTDSEREHLLVTLNDSFVDYPSTLTMVDLFMQHAQRVPNSIAVIAPNDKRITYKELDEASNRLANYLRAQGVTSGDRVGVYFERGIDMMVSLFGVMKSGASYVPLDPMFPQDRLAFMAQDAGLKFVLTQSSLAASVPGEQCTKGCANWSSSTK